MLRKIDFVLHSRTFSSSTNRLQNCRSFTKVLLKRTNYDNRGPKLITNSKELTKSCPDINSFYYKIWLTSIEWNFTCIRWLGDCDIHSINNIIIVLKQSQKIVGKLNVSRKMFYYNKYVHCTYIGLLLLWLKRTEALSNYFFYQFLFILVSFQLW